MDWSETEGGGFFYRHGPAHARGEEHCNRKLCITATDEEALLALLDELAARDDCYYVKRSRVPREGMFIGRCFLTDEQEIGRLWQELKVHPKFYCSVQDDDWSEGFRTA